jgi:hypothetical protein
LKQELWKFKIEKQKRIFQKDGKVGFNLIFSFQDAIIIKSIIKVFEEIFKSL